jgi:hypothetical protein
MSRASWSHGESNVDSARASVLICPRINVYVCVQAAPQLSVVSAALRRPPVPRPGLDSSRPGRRLLDEREMEMIELGGAPP